MLNGFLPVARLAHNLEAGFRFQNGAQALAHQCLVFNKKYTDHKQVGVRRQPFVLMYPQSPFVLHKSPLVSPEQPLKLRESPLALPELLLVLREQPLV